MSTIQLKFFARLREELGTHELDVPAGNAPDLESLIRWLIQQHPGWQRSLEAPLLQAVNQEMVNGNPSLQAGDEVALFPPVTGG